MPTLYLIDGYAQFFRNYHAIRTPMTSPVTKEPTNMTFGFLGAFLKLLRGEGNIGGRPDFIAVALDVSGDRGTFRSRLLPEYKAHRPPAPEDLFPQVTRCLNTLRELGVPIYGAEGYEADDVIASIVSTLRRSNPDLRIRIVSKDKDLKQLLESPRGSDGAPVELFDLHTDLAFGVAELKAETGLDPSQVIDMLSLMGDAVDNVPGVPGVGDKTAALLLREYGSLDSVIANADFIKGKRGENIRAAAASLPLARELITLKRDITPDEGPFSLIAANARNLKLETLLPTLRELGFNRYQTELRALTGDTLPGDASSDSASAPTRPGRSVQDQTGRTASSRMSADDPGSLFAFEQTASAASSSSTSNAGPASTFSNSRAGRAEPAVSFGELFDCARSENDLSAPDEITRANLMQGRYTCITTGSQLYSLIDTLRRAKAIAIDTETTELSPLNADLCGISVATEPGYACYIPVRSPDPTAHLDERTVLDALRPLLEDPAMPKIGHNLKYDILVLRRAGIKIAGFSTEGSCDSLIASYLIDSSRSSHGLESLSLALLGVTKHSISELIGSGKTQRSFVTVPIELATPYAARDADLSLQLAALMLPRLRALGMNDLFYKLELPLVAVLAELEWNGILVDPDELDRQRERIVLRIRAVKEDIDDRAMEAIARTFDPDSPKQLAAALFNKPDAVEPGLGIKPIRKTKTGYSTDAEVLDKLAADATLTTPIPKLILEYRQLTKLVNTYLVNLKEAINSRTHRIHASFNQTGAATGRLSSSDPNLQNVPIRTDIGREIRKAFLAPPGRTLITADYSQIELRLLAHLSRDPNLIEAFMTGQDIHRQVAAQIHNVSLEAVTKDQRNGAKMVNFGIVYGVTPYGLARRLNIGDREAAGIIDGYKRRFAGITTFLQECIDQARRFGYVETMMKRRRLITDIESANPSMRSLAERVAINSVVQGSAADLIKIAMVDLHERVVEEFGREPDLGSKEGSRSERPLVRMLLQIHDELVFECPEPLAERALKLIVERMESAMSLTVPLKAEAHVGRTWFEGK